MGGGPSPQDDQQIVQIQEALERQNTFYLQRHGAEELGLHLLRSHQDFFALPDEEKMRVAARSAQGPGYHLRDPGHQVFVTLGDMPVGVAPSAADKNLWPTQPPGLAGLTTRYLDKMYELSMALLRAIARSLGLSGDFFDPFFGPGALQNLQLHHYDGAQTPSGHEFLSSHVDPTALTLIAQDDGGGLESLIAQQWVPVSPVPGALVVQQGEFLARWTNDRYPASVHRVLSPTAAVRRSVVYSLVPRPDATVECLPGCVDDRHPARYATTTVASYLDAWAPVNSARIEPPRDDSPGAPRKPEAVRCVIPDELRERVATSTDRRWSIRSATRRGGVLGVEFGVDDRAFTLHMQAASQGVACYKELHPIAFWYQGRIEHPIDLPSIDRVIHAIVRYAACQLGMPSALAGP